MQKELPNINTYLTYANEPLAEKNYNEVDALILAQLSYMPFEMIIRDFETADMPICHFANVVRLSKLYYGGYSEDEKIFLLNLSQSKRFLNCNVHRLRVISTEDTQWAAFTMDIKGEEVSVVAIRGTNKTTVGWAEDLRLGYSIMGTGAQIASFRYLKETNAEKLYLTGHSKGGSNVSSAYVMSDPSIRDKILRIDNFDGPGMNPEFTDNYKNGYKELGNKLYNFYPQDGVIGLLLEDNPGHTFFVESKVRESYVETPILGQHDPFSFVVEGDRFVKTKQTYTSHTINKATDLLMKETSNSQRYSMIQFLERIGVPGMIAGDKKETGGRKE